MIDEIHTCNSFGRSFRPEFEKLMSHLFSTIAHLAPTVFLTATYTDRVKTSFEKW